LTHTRRGAYRARLTVRAHPRTAAIVAALALVALACSPPPVAGPGPLDHVTFPTAIKLQGQDLLAVSSNFDLTYSLAEGGSVLAIPLPPGVGQTLPPGRAMTRGTNIGSLGGELAIADASCGFSSPIALVPSRSTNTLYRLAFDANGTPSCGSGCALPLRNNLADPYGVTVACGNGKTRAFLSHMRTPDSNGYVTMLTLDSDLSRWAATVQVGVAGPGPARSFAYDADRDRVYFTGLSTGTTTLFRWYDLAGNCSIEVAQTDPTACPLGAIDIFPLVRGADLRGIALSNPIPGKPRRAYVAARVFDADLAVTIGGRPNFDVAGVLLVLELDEGPDGRPQPRLVNWVNAGLGASEVAVLPPRQGGVRDLVAVTAGDDGLVWIYDDEVGEMRKVFGRDPVNGAPELGRTPYALAVTPLDGAPPPTTSVTACQGAASACARVYVGAFQDAWVGAVDVPLDDPGSAGVVTVNGAPWRIGGAP
jgi:hypothetical protein